jgi:hypothetical protein
MEKRKIFHAANSEMYGNPYEKGPEGCIDNYGVPEKWQMKQG